jgi:exodeoxyribonuclease V alpha subunit
MSYKNNSAHNTEKFEYLSGNIERITYHNQENGFAVLKVNVRGKKNLVSVIGVVPSISVGEDITAKGFWRNNIEHGIEFRAEFIKSIPPTTLEGIEKYLGSGLIKGIGIHFAKKLVAAFKEEVFDVIENNPGLLKTIRGVGKKRVESITKNWSEQKIVRQIMVFLQSHGVGTAKSTRIYKTYGEEAIKVVSDNPYKLAKDIRGIGFISADKIANNLGIAENSIIRARAGIGHILMEALSDGHIALPENLLINNTQELLSIEKEIIVDAIKLELVDEYLKKDTIEEKEFIFLSAYYFYEKNIAKRLKEISPECPQWNDINKDKAIEWVEEKINIKLASNQNKAVRLVLSNKASVITGGPGTGKTTILNCIIKVIKAKNYKIKLCAPTGRAAKRLSETTNNSAYTIHRLLKFEPGIGDFKYNQDNPIDCDLLIIDESSMVDVQLMNSLLKALPEKSGLLLVGDVDQLPSVGAGQVLKDIIDSNKIPTVKLTEIYRQAEDSEIITNAHLINKGQMPNLKSNKPESDFYYIEANEPELIIDKIKTLVKERIPKKFNVDPIRHIQVLCPMQRGGCGARFLNLELQKLLNPNYQEGVEKYGQIYAINDKVMQLTNNYDKDVYNGDIGYVNGIDHVEKELLINFDGAEIKYEFSELDELTLSYATTIHKSQGSEYPVIVMPIAMQHYLMLKKNLLYTGITRGRKLVILIGQQKAIAIAIKNKQSDIRHSKLKEWLIK